MKISHAAGHALSTAGKETPCGMKEWSFSSVVATYVMDDLNEYEGVEQRRFDDVTGKVDIPLNDRSDRINVWGADVHLDYHANAFGTGGWNSANGIETYIHPSHSKESFQLAKLIQDNLIKATGLSNRGVKKANFHMLRETDISAKASSNRKRNVVKASALLEMGFMTNQREAELLKSDGFRRKCAKAIVDSLVFLYGLKKKEVVQVANANENQADKFAVEAQKWVIENKISDGTRPRDPVTRQEQWVMMWRAAGSPKV